MIREILSVRERNEQDISPLESVARAMQRQDLLGREGQERKQRCGKRHAHHVPKVRAHGDRDILECVPDTSRCRVSHSQVPKLYLRPSMKTAGLSAIIAAIFVLAPQSNVTLNAATTEILGIDILGLTKSAKDMPDHQYPTH